MQIEVVTYGGWIDLLILTHLSFPRQHMEFRKQLHVDKIITEWRPPEVNYSRPPES